MKIKLKRQEKIEYDDREPSDGGVIPAAWSSRKRLPVGMLGIAVMIWAMATENYVWGTVVAVGLEAMNFFWSRRVRVGFKTQRRAWLVTIGFLWWVGISAWLENTPIDAVRIVLTWAPMTLLPLVIVGITGVRGGVPMTVFPYVFRARIRRHRRNGRDYEAPRFSPHLPFVTSLMLGASYGWSRTIDDRWWFLLVSAVMLAWVWVDESGRFRDVGSRRSVRRRLPGYVLSVVLVVVFAGASSYGIKRLHDWAENGGFSGRAKMGRGSSNRASIQLGQVGEIQLSREVMWRVKTLQGIAPDRVCDGVFDLIRTSVWINRSNRSFLPMGDVGGDGFDVRDSWPLSPMTGSAPDVGQSGDSTHSGVDLMWRFELYGAALANYTVIPLPKSPLSVSDLPAYELERNGLGVVRATLAQPVMKAKFLAAPTRVPQLGALAPVLENDLDVGDAHQQIFDPIADELGLKEMTDHEKVLAVHAFFSDGFSYSLKDRPSDLGSFVTTNRQGHCELYATSTVLLLRAAGVPARYHTGFVIEEYDEDEQCYLLRGVHAHAWAEAWIAGRWQVVDTTPADWQSLVGSEATWWQRLTDRVQLWLMDFRYWRSSLEASEWASYVLPWAVGIVVIYIVVRVWFGRKGLFQSRRGGAGADLIRVEDGGRCRTTHWDQLRPAVERAYGEIPETTAVRRWVMGHAQIAEPIRARMIRVVRSHYRARFAGVGAVEADEMKALSDELRSELANVVSNENSN